MAEKLWQNMFHLKTIWSLKDLKRQKKFRNFLSAVTFSLIFTAANTFSLSTLVCTTDILTGFLFQIPSLRTGFEFALSLGLPSLATCTSAPNCYVLILVLYFTFLFANFTFTATDTAIIRSSRLVLFCKKILITNFAKLILNEAVDLQHLTLSKKRLPHRYFLVNFGKYLRTPFLQNFFERLLLLT